MTTFIRELQCYVDSMKYDFNTKTGTLYLAEYSCTDFAGCIKFFERIDPRVESINTFSGDRQDTSYKFSTDRWIVMPRPNKKAAPKDGLIGGG